MPLQPDLTLTDIYRMLSRRRVVILYSIVGFVIIGILVCLFMKPRYVATEKIQVEKDGSGPLGLASAIGQDAVPLDSIDYNTTLQTQAEVLQSEALAVKTIEDLGLEKTYNYLPTFSFIGPVLSLISPSTANDPKDVALHDAPKRRFKAVKVFENHLKVKVTDGTRIIAISYTDPDPKIAAAVVNHLVESFIDYNYQMRFAATSQASNWLGTQLTDLKKNAEDSQARVAKLQQDAQVYSTGDTDMNGHVTSVSVTLSRLQDLSTALSTAQTNRILKQAVYYSVRDGGADAISGLSGNMITGGASQEVINSMSVLQGLRTQQATLKAEYARESAKFGSDYPLIQQLSKQLDDIGNSITEELQRITNRAKSDYEIALQAEQNTRSLYQTQKEQADTLNGKTIEYTVAKQEAEDNRGLYQDLYRRLKEAGALQGLRSTNISIVDPAAVPGKPKYPNPIIFMPAAIILGIFAGAAYAIFMDRTDKSLLDIDQVEFALGTRPLTILPDVSPNAGRTFSLNPWKKSLPSSAESARVNPWSKPTPSLGDSKSLLLDSGSGKAGVPLAYPLKHPDSSYTEALRVLRTSIVQSAAENSSQVLLVTSCQPGDGKTSLSINLAVVLVQQGYKVLVVDCNMRRPAMRTVLGLSSTEGLREMLSNSNSPSAIRPIPDLPGGYVLAAGGGSPHSTESLGSEDMKTLIADWRGQYDFIILDAPPVLGISDALVLLGVSDIALLMVRYQHTTRQAMNNAYRLLKSAAKQKQVSVVVNAVPENSDALNDYYGYKVEPYVAV